MSTKANDQSGRIIDAGPAGFVIRFPYSADLVELVKTIEGRRYDPATKSWTVPLGRSAEVSNLVSRHSFVATEAARKGLANPTALRPVVSGSAGVTRVDDTFYIKFPYDKAKVEAVKSIDGRRWNPDDKMWSAPLSSVRGVRWFCQQFGLATTAVDGVPDSDPVIEPEIRKIPSGYVIDFAYDRDLVQRVREIPTAKFDRENKVWIVRNSAKEEVIDFAEATSAILDEALEVSFADFSERRRRYAMSLATDSDLEIPMMSGTLKGFQKAAIRFVLDSLGFEESEGTWKRVLERAKRGAFIGDEQGLGKTIQTLGVLEATGAFPAVIVAPTSVRKTWEREATKWIPHRSVEIVYGIEPHEVEADIVVIGWDTLHGWSKSIPVKSAVFDEMHYAKNERSRRTLAAVELSQRAFGSGGFALALSGTPLLNRPVELKSQLNIIGRLEEFGGSRGFDALYVRAEEPDLAGLGARLRETCFVRRLKRDVMPELGDKEYASLVVEGDDDVMETYRLAEAGLRHELGEELKRAVSMAKGATKSERMAAGLREFRKRGNSHLADLEYLRQLAAKAKRESVREWIEDFSSNEKKLVVFAWHRDDVEWVADTFGNGLKIIGGMSDADKQDAIDRFQNSDDEKIIACSLKAAGVGLTLTAASDVLFIEQGWNPADMDQAADRCHRIGQKDSVTVYTMLCEGTVDERIAQLIDEKRKVVNAVMDGGDVDSMGGVSMAVLEAYAREAWDDSEE
jgi:SWI/SNF-related matrix-associated actin-dependent regulator 1 of chromatin subfamily A